MGGWLGGGGEFDEKALAGDGWLIDTLVDVQLAMGRGQPDRLMARRRPPPKATQTQTNTSLNPTQSNPTPQPRPS